MSEKPDPSIYKSMFTDQDKLNQINEAAFNWNPPQELKETLNCQQCHWSFTGTKKEIERAEAAHICYPKHVDFAFEVNKLQKMVDRYEAQSDAVRHLHKPYVKGVDIYCTYCRWGEGYAEPYPCETILALLDDPKLKTDGFSWTVGND